MYQSGTHSPTRSALPIGSASGTSQVAASARFGRHPSTSITTQHAAA